MSYQSFPWAQGDSVSPAKLIALDLPKLEGKSFLDVGCNAGFFCGFADWQGAARVVGVDSSAAFLETARELFPRCEFICQDWSNIGEEKFDVIIFSRPFIMRPTSRPCSICSWIASSPAACLCWKSASRQAPKTSSWK